MAEYDKRTIIVIDWSDKKGEGTSTRTQTTGDQMTPKVQAMVVDYLFRALGRVNVRIAP